jgi:sec-independent protein translocase protein TatA
MGIENPIHLIFLAGVALLVLGPKRLPEVARSLGKGIREFRDAMSDGSAGGFMHAHEDGAPTSAAAPASPPPDAEVVAGGGSGLVQDVGLEGSSAGGGSGLVQPAPPEGVAGGDVAPGAGIEDAAVVDDTPAQVDPGEPVRSGDAPDRRPL